MFKEIENIIVSGGCYGSETTLEKILSQSFNIVYGRNGSGKSSLARAIYEYARNVPSPKFQMSFQPGPNDEGKSRIFVFSEDFVLNNVKMAKDGLNQIVMIGEQVALSNDEDELKKESEAILSDINSMSDKLESLNKDWLGKENDLLKILKRSYAERERDFRGIGRNPNVTLKTITEIGGKSKDCADKHDIAALANDIAEGTKLMKGTSDAQKISWEAPTLAMQNLVDRCNGLLEMKVERVDLDERDKLLLSILSDSSLSRYANSAKEVLIDRKATVCPLCMRPLEKHTLDELEAQIKRVLNKDVENYRDSIKRCIDSLPVLNDNVPAFTVDKYKDDITSFKDSVRDLNQSIGKVRERLESKSNNPFNVETPLDVAGLDEVYDTFNKACRKLEQDVTEFNRNIDERTTFINMLIEKNQILAYLENKQVFQDYFKSLSDKDEAIKTIARLEERKKEKDKEISDLASKRAQTKIAVDFINDSLAFMFFDDERLVLEDQHGKFILKSRGVPVAPDSVSTGERNIIGMAYFFASIFENTSVSDRYSRPSLVIIDDPITSFDQDNKMGLMAFLRYHLTKLLVGNDDSKVLVMSHDQRTVDMLVSINRSVQNSIRYEDKKKGKQNNTSHDDYFIYELHKKERRKVEQMVNNEYSQLLRFLYSFACDKDTSKIEYVGIGNVIRRVMESYSLMTFNTYDYVRAVDGEHLRLWVPDGFDKDEMRKNFRHYLTRIVLNAESHSPTKTDQDSYESTFTRSNLQLMAKYALLFIMCTNDRHLHTSLEKGWKSTMIGWLGDKKPGTTTK